MTRFRLTNAVAEDAIRGWAKTPGMQCVCSTRTPWWSLWDEAWMPYRTASGLPCDPRGCVLMQGDLAKFLANADADPKKYGQLGVKTLFAAFHSNVEVLTRDGRGWRPTCLDDWKGYEDLLLSSGVQPC